MNDWRTWDVGVFDNNAALAVRDAFEKASFDNALSDGDADNAYEEVLALFEDELSDEVHEISMILALASLGLERGDLPPLFKGLALSAIESGAPLEGWDNEPVDAEKLAARRQVLEELKRKLQQAS